MPDTRHNCTLILVGRSLFGVAIEDNQANHFAACAHTCSLLVNHYVHLATTVQCAAPIVQGVAVVWQKQPPASRPMRPAELLRSAQPSSCYCRVHNTSASVEPGNSTACSATKTFCPFEMEASTWPATSRSAFAPLHNQPWARAEGCSGGRPEGVNSCAPRCTAHGLLPIKEPFIV